MSNRVVHWMPVGTALTVSGKAACGATAGFKLPTSIFTDNVTCSRCLAKARQ
jgi:hypothetical protein